MARLKKLPGDRHESAKAVGLRYVSPDALGITRRGKRFFRPEGLELNNPLDLARIKSLVIPPAWKRVWICPLAKGHLQAIGYDQRGRRQYRYHPAFRKIRDATKFARMVAFGKALPKIRRRVETDLELRGIPQQKLLAALVRLLEETSIRVGGEEYARANDSFGLTTLNHGNVHLAGAKVSFGFGDSLIWRQPDASLCFLLAFLRYSCEKNASHPKRASSVQRSICTANSLIKKAFTRIYFASYDFKIPPLCDPNFPKNAKGRVNFKPNFPKSFPRRSLPNCASVNPACFSRQPQRLLNTFRI